MASHRLLATCRWPDLPQRFDVALRKAVEYILDSYNPWGIIAAGTIVRGTPDHSSDLDLYVIHGEPYRQRVQRFFNEVPAEIFINPPASIRSYFRDEHADGRPVTAHMLATGRVILSRAEIVETLRREATEWLDKPIQYPPARLVWDRYMAATKYEDALDIADKDPVTAALLLNEAVAAMLHYWYRRHGMVIPRSKELVTTLAAVDGDLGAMVEQFFTKAPEERLAVAELIADRTIETDGFFEWESERENVRCSS